jgi:hypothetical protein
MSDTPPPIVPISQAHLFDTPWDSVETKYRRFLQDANDMLLVARSIESANDMDTVHSWDAYPHALELLDDVGGGSATAHLCTEYTPSSTRNGTDVRKMAASSSRRFLRRIRDGAAGGAHVRHPPDPTDHAVKGSLRGNEANGDLHLRLIGPTRWINFNHLICVDLSRSGMENATTHQDFRVLKNVLHAFALDRPHIGYCQGLNFMVTMLLRRMRELEAFHFMGDMFDGYGMDGLFEHGLPRFHCCIYQMECLLRLHVPKLHAYFKEIGISSTMYASAWFMTLFSSCNTMPLVVVEHLWDIFFCGGWKSFFRIITALLYRLQDSLLQLDFTSVVEFLQFIPMSSAAMLQLQEESRKIKITRRMLRAFKDEYASIDFATAGSSPTPPQPEMVDLLYPVYCITSVLYC